MGNYFAKNHELMKPRQNGQTRSVEIDRPGGGTHQDPPSYTLYPRSQTPEKPASQPPPWRMAAAAPGPSPKTTKSNSILENAFEDVMLFYTLGKELGRGQFGVHVSVHREFDGEEIRLQIDLELGAGDES